jgi:hypothetical protein
MTRLMAAHLRGWDREGLRQGVADRADTALSPRFGLVPPLVSREGNEWWWCVRRGRGGRVRIGRGRGAI